MNTDDSFYKFQQRPDLSEDGVRFQYRSPENDWASDKTQAGGAGGSEVTHPLQLYVGKAGSDFVVRVRYGTVWGKVPPQVQKGSSPDDITPSDGKLVWAKVTVNATTGLFVSCAVESGSAVPANSGTLGYWLIGQINVSDTGAVTTANAVTHSLNGKTCGTSIYDWWGV